MKGRRILWSVLLMFMPVSILAEVKEIPDSLSQTYDLQELVVEGVTQKVRDDGVEYIPGKKVKRTSYNAITLLDNMQMPQVIVSPMDGSIKSPNGSAYSIYINYFPASEEDMQALLPEDVLKVEVLSSSQDPRFTGNRTVINILVRRREWGGYTKLMASGVFLSREKVTGSVYQKVNHKKWSFDASASGAGVWMHHDPSYLKETFRDFTYGGVHYDQLSRETETHDSKTRNNNQSATARALWDNNGNTIISHTLSFSRQATPRMHYLSTMTYDGDFMLPSEAGYDSRNQNLNAAVSGDYRFLFPRDSYLAISWTFSHSGTKSYSTYSPKGGEAISNSNRERSYAPVGSIFYQKGLGHNNSMGFALQSYNTIYDTDYFGSYAGRQDLTSSEDFLWLSYAQYWPFGLSLNGGVGASLTLGRLNGEFVNKKLSPRLEFELQYRLRQKNLFSLEAWIYNSHPSPTTTNSALVRTDDLLWIEGNPGLRTSRGVQFYAGYSYIPSNRLSLIAGIKYTNNMHGDTYLYRPYVGGDGIIRSFSDDNRFQQLTLRGGVSMKFLNNSLAVHVRGNYSHETRTGAEHKVINVPEGRVFISYYVGSFSFRVFYVTPSKTIIDKGGYLFRTPSETGLDINYGARNLNVSLVSRNWFGKGHIRQSYTSPYYSSNGWKWDPISDSHLALTITYTLKYGKKIDQSDDLENKAKKNSAILE